MTDSLKITDKPTITLINDDCLNYMRSMPDKSVDLVLTDPPYFSGGRDGSTHLNNKNTFGNRMGREAMIWFVRGVAQECYRITQDVSHCYVFTDWRKYTDTKCSWESVGWECRSLLIWDKSNGMGEYWRSTHEFIIFFTKIQPAKLRHGGCFNVLKYPSVKNKEHPAEKPVELICDLLKASSDYSQTIFDPFMGSGTTGVACKLLRRNFIGCEIDKKYFELAKRRIDSTEFGLF